MCACGKKKALAVTSVNAEHEAAERRLAEKQAYDSMLGEVITEAERTTLSATRAIGNTRS